MDDYLIVNENGGYTRGGISLYDDSAKMADLLETKNAILTEELALERKARLDAERKYAELQLAVEELQNVKKRNRRTRKEIESEEAEEYSEFKTDGKRKARPASPIRSYEDFAAIANHFLERGKIRDWALWMVGVSMGLRISDLLSLKVHDILNPDKTFKKRVIVKERKTNKANNCLITESVVYALAKYFDSIKWTFDLDDYIFKSNKTKGKMYEEYGWKILSDAGKALELPINIGSHTMRKSFANIVACVDKSCIDMNSVTKIQGLLNHSDQKVTMKYLGTYQTMFDHAREAVSDFVLGKTDVHELVAGNNATIDDIIDKLNNIETKLDTERKEDYAD